MLPPSTLTFASMAAAPRAPYLNGNKLTSLLTRGGGLGPVIWTESHGIVVRLCVYVCVGVSARSHRLYRWGPSFLFSLF